MALQEFDFANHFGIGNIPFGIASSVAHPEPQAVTRYENRIIFLADLEEVRQDYYEVLKRPALNAFAALGQTAHNEVRGIVQQLLRSSGVPRTAEEDIRVVRLHLPVDIGDYTDFSCSPTHNRNAPAALMGQPGKLAPAYKHIPLGYAGRCSSIVLSGTNIVRPRGHFFEYGVEGLQGKRTDVLYGPTRKLDYELEMAAVIGKPVAWGDYIKSTVEASQHIFGYVLLNDWSSRDIQQLEMIPVGPFQSKHSATTISAWIVVHDALVPFLKPVSAAASLGQAVAPHLTEESSLRISVDVSVSVIKEDDRQEIARTNLTEMSWSFNQIVAHQASGGGGLRAGDLLAVGTISGPGPSEQGCLMEEFVPGKTPVRGYIQDNEAVQIVGSCGPGVGFGQCTAAIMMSVDTDVWTAPI